MNIEETKKAIAVMQAFVDGKEIQYLSLDKKHWFEHVNLNHKWDWANFEYRIKPEVVRYRRAICQNSADAPFYISVWYPHTTNL